MKLTSVIMPCYVQTLFQAHMSMAALANITKYTDPDEYEMIVIEDIPKFPIRDDYHVLKIDTHITLNQYTNYSTKMNMATKKAKGDYLVFIQNDVFIWEGWLEGMRYYLDNDLADIVFPDQIPRSREFVKQSYKLTPEEAIGQGARDAGMFMITRQGFEKSGGFNDDLKIFVEADFYERLGATGVRQVTTNKTLFTHIALGTHYSLPMEEMEEKMNHDSLIRNK